MVAKGFALHRLAQLYLLYARMDLAWFMRDTKFCLMAICSDFIANMAAVAGIFLLAWKFDGVGGMDRYEVLFMLGYITFTTGIFQLFFTTGNTGHISRKIGRGQLEHMFIQPVPLGVQLLTEGFIPVSGKSNLLSGGLIINMALANLDLSLPWWWILWFCFNALVTTGIIVTLHYLFSVAAFYAPVQAEEITSYVGEATGKLSSYPLSGMALVIQIPLISIFPAGLLGWFPTLSLLGTPPLGMPHLFPFLVLLALFLITNIAFQKGLKHYVTTGTNRYSSIGHRR